MKLEHKIESLLFIKTEGVSISYLAQKCGVKEVEIKSALKNLESLYVERGIVLVMSDEHVMFATSPEMHTFMSEYFEEDETKELSTASLQTMAIILYKGKATRGEISYIRGVDSRMSVRNLLIRGLIVKADKEYFTATVDALRYLGIEKIEQLPKWNEIHNRLTQSTENSNG